jgi:hypothetical protein
VLRWQPSRTTFAILLLLTLGSFGVVQGMKLQQLSLLVGGLVAAGMFLLAGGQLFLAGVVLALATIKPQLMVLLTLWLMLWVLGNWRERQRLFWGFTVSLILLFVGGEYLLPGWIGRFADGVVAYEHYTGGGSLLDVLTTRTGGTLLTIFLLLGTAAVCWRLRHAAAGSAAFNLATALVLAVTVVVVPMTAPYNQILLLPAIFLVVRSWKALWQKTILSRVLCSVAALIVFWPGLASLALLLASLVLPATSVQQAWAVPLWMSLFVPLAILPLLDSLLASTLHAEADNGLEAGLSLRVKKPATR